MGLWTCQCVSLLALYYEKEKNHYQISIWSSSEDSNFLTDENLKTLYVKWKICENGWLTGANMALATENTVVEAVMYKENFASEKLFEFIVRLRQA